MNCLNKKKSEKTKSNKMKTQHTKSIILTKKEKMEYFPAEHCPQDDKD